MLHSRKCNSAKYIERKTQLWVLKNAAEQIALQVIQEFNVKVRKKWKER